jgi:Domain of unknown function (DUF4331)
MKMHIRSIALRAAALVALYAAGAAGCTTASSSLPAVQHRSTYLQIERLSRPAVKEAFENFSNHDQSNRTAPTQDNLLHDSIVTFMESDAGRDATTSTTLAAILTPDEMQADLNKTVAGCGNPNAPCGAYLGVETGGATGDTFGGRWLNDDVIDISLGAIFGNTLAALGVVPDDHHESPCLTTDNVGPAQAYGTTFPYVNTPY